MKEYIREAIRKMDAGVYAFGDVIFEGPAGEPLVRYIGKTARLNDHIAWSVESNEPMYFSSDNLKENDKTETKSCSLWKRICELVTDIKNNL